jgi:hypothetical protein
MAALAGTQGRGCQATEMTGKIKPTPPASSRDGRQEASGHRTRGSSGSWFSDVCAWSPVHAIRAGPDSSTRGKQGGWRRGRDLNPRYGCPYAAFRVRCDRPLCHLSGSRAGGGVFRSSFKKKHAPDLVRGFRFARKGRRGQKAVRRPANSSRGTQVDPWPPTRLDSW